MASFEPAKVYADDYQYFDFVEDVTCERDGTSVTGLKARWDDSGPSDVQNMAVGLGYSTEAAAVVVWQPTPTDVAQADREPTFAPQPGDVLRRTTKSNQGWIVREVLASRFGHWTLGCTREVENA